MAVLECASFRIMTQIGLLARFTRSVLNASSLRFKVNSSSQQYLLSRGWYGVTSGCAASYTSSNDTGGTDQTQTPKKKKRKSRKSKAKEDDVTSSDKSTSDVPKKKRKSKKVLTDEEIMDSLIGPFIPFEGDSSNKTNAGFCFERQDLPDGRFYRHQSSTNSYSFPSVTTVLDKTMDSSYPLFLWKRKLTELHGKKGFDAIRNNTLKCGINFHKVRW